MKSIVSVTALAAALLASGCARFSPDAGMGVVESATAAELGKEVMKIDNKDKEARAAARVKQLLAKPLTAASAVQIALLNNRGLQAAYNDLGISEAEMVEASLPPAPRLSFSRIIGSGGFEIERQIVQNVLALFTLPRRREIAEARFRQAQIRAVEATLRISAETSRAYYRSVAANESVKFLTEAQASAQTVSELAKRLGETGAMAKLDQAREHVFYAEISGQLASARIRQRVEKERLTRALGAWGIDTAYRLPDKLTILPSKPKTLTWVEREAVKRRVDLIIARMEIDILAKELGLTRTTRFINALDVAGVSANEKSVAVSPGGDMETEKVRRRGFALDFEIPIYDFGETRVRHAEETYMRSVNRLLEKAVNVRSEAREAYQGYRGAYDIARHYDREVLPLRKIISEEALLNYNAMIRDLFTLLADARARILANVQAIEARRDFWLASVDLHTAIVGGRGGEAAEASRAPAAGGGEAGGH
ncbi:MAG: TolC family protein [Hyphomonadaceae bacterium]|nr:TolC family protein [Hyphomonadaceae bacterium]